MGLEFQGDPATMDFFIQADTLPPEIPAPEQYYTEYSNEPVAAIDAGNFGTGASPAIADIPRTQTPPVAGGSFDVLNSVKSGANALLNTWGQVVNIQDKLANAQFQRTVTQQTTQLQQSKTLGDLANTASAIQAQQAIEKARIGLSVANDQAKLAASSPAAQAAASKQKIMLMFAAAAVGLAALYLTRKGKK